MAKWRKNESMGHALGRESRGIAKGVVKGLLSIATLGLYKPKKYLSAGQPQRTEVVGNNRMLPANPMRIDLIQIGFRYRKDWGADGDGAATVQTHYGCRTFALEFNGPANSSH